MISVIFRKLTMDRVKARRGRSAKEQAMREAAQRIQRQLGFISAIGAIGRLLYSKSVRDLSWT